MNTYAMEFTVDDRRIVSDPDYLDHVMSDNRRRFLRELVEKFPDRQPTVISIDTQSFRDERDRCTRFRYTADLKVVRTMDVVNLRYDPNEMLRMPPKPAAPPPKSITTRMVDHLRSMFREVEYDGPRG